MRRVLAVWALMLAPAIASAQSSQFGVRGLGYTGRPISAGAAGTAGAFGMFDPQSSLNPAALGPLQTLIAGFTGVQDYRHVENEAGTASLRDTRFPQVAVAGNIRRFPLVLGASFSNYLTRDFTVATVDTITLRDEAVPVADTLSSRGGISDLRLAGAYRLRETLIVGGGFHIFTGTNRIESRRTFADASFLPTTQRSELSFAGVGFEASLLAQLVPAVWVAALARSDGHAAVDVDSTRVATTDLPYTFGLGLQWQRNRLELASHAIYRTWSGANSDLLAQGGVGSENTIELALGGVYASNVRQRDVRPLRFGVRYATLPFLLNPGEQPSEFAVSVGTGTRFAQQRAGVDLALEHVWRKGGDESERAFLLTIGISVRP